MGWNFGVLDKDSGVRKTLEQMEQEYAKLKEAETAIPVTEPAIEPEEYEYDDR